LRCSVFQIFSTYPPPFRQDFNVEERGGELADALAAAADFLRTASRTGVIVQKAESRPKHDGGEEEFCTFQVT